MTRSSVNSFVNNPLTESDSKRQIHIKREKQVWSSFVNPFDRPVHNNHYSDMFHVRCWLQLGKDNIKMKLGEMATQKCIFNMINTFLIIVIFVAFVSILVPLWNPCDRWTLFGSVCKKIMLQTYLSNIWHIKYINFYELIITFHCIITAKVFIRKEWHKTADMFLTWRWICTVQFLL